MTYIWADLEVLASYSRMFTVYTHVGACTPPSLLLWFNPVFCFQQHSCWCNRVAGKNRLVLLWLCLIASCVSMCEGTVYMFDCALASLLLIKSCVHAHCLLCPHCSFWVPWRWILCISSLMKAPPPPPHPTHWGVEVEWGGGVSFWTLGSRCVFLLALTSRLMLLAGIVLYNH